ncbi:Hypothetical_protein [Hexamita inflata]|uniref:Hypothetical_protein n=1 Tax=Hexamita inflata TaxID=28002 RepID=A0AA86N734_9EUKA|nr:Hypothetical protein HINF_LOCUS1556 [Hexamita inflata]
MLMSKFYYQLSHTCSLERSNYFCNNRFVQIYQLDKLQDIQIDLLGIIPIQTDSQLNQWPIRMLWLVGFDQYIDTKSRTFLLLYSNIIHYHNHSFSTTNNFQQIFENRIILDMKFRTSLSYSDIHRYKIVDTDINYQINFKQELHLIHFFKYSELNQYYHIIVRQ